MRIVGLVLFIVIVGGLFGIKNSLGVLQSDAENVGVCLAGVFIWFLIIMILYKYIVGNEEVPATNPYYPPPPQYGYYQQGPQYQYPYQQGAYQQAPYQQSPYQQAPYQNPNARTCRFCGGRLSNVTSTCPHCGNVN